MEKFKAFLKLMRPRYSAQMVGIVAISSITTHGVSLQSFYAIISILFLSVATFFFDDAHDYESDRIVHPQRPIPKGYITVSQAYLAAAILLFTGISSASMLLFYQFALFLLLSIISISIVFFNFKSMVRAFLTAFFLGALFPFGAFPDLKSLFFGLIIALPHVGGSIAKDFIHSRGDRVQGLEPPQNWLRYLASTAFFLCGVILWLPLIMNFVSWFYIPPIIVTNVSCVMLGVSILKGGYEKVYIYGGMGMFSALIAFLLGEI